MLEAFPGTIRANLDEGMAQCSERANGGRLRTCASLAGQVGLSGLPGLRSDVRYSVGATGQVIVLTSDVLFHFEKNRQSAARAPEAGGQLFAEISAPYIRIARATGPRVTDGRSRVYFQPDRRAERREIEVMFAEHLHYVGDWHTHPVRVPFPSERDVASMRDCFRRSAHDLNAFLMIVVGTAAPPRGLHVSIHDANSSLVLVHE